MPTHFVLILSLVGALVVEDLKKLLHKILHRFIGGDTLHHAKIYLWAFPCVFSHVFSKEGPRF